MGIFLYRDLAARIKAAVYIDPGVWIGPAPGPCGGGGVDSSANGTSKPPRSNNANAAAPSANLAFKLFTRIVAFILSFTGPTPFYYFGTRLPPPARCGEGGKSIHVNA